MKRMTGWSIVLAWVLLQCSGPALAAPLATVTILEGEARLLRDGARLALAEGVRLQADDIVELDEQGRLLRLEFADGLRLSLGSGSRALLAPRLAGERAGARLYLLQGWAKLNAEQAARVATPRFDVSRIAGAAVIAVQADGGQLFAETGTPVLHAPGEPPLALRSGEFASGAGAARAAVAGRPGAAFLAQLPRPFMENLPARIARFQDRDVAPKRTAALGYADLRAWLNAEPALRQGQLPVWRPLARDPDFRRQLTAEMRLHPEWQALLQPPAPPNTENRP